jgi:hypothetical protein
MNWTNRLRFSAGKDLSFFFNVQNSAAVYPTLCIVIAGHFHKGTTAVA